MTIFSLSTAIVGIAIGGCRRRCLGSLHPPTCPFPRRGRSPRLPPPCPPPRAAFTRGWEMTLVMLAVTPVLAGLGFAISVFMSKNTVGAPLCCHVFCTARQRPALPALRSRGLSPHPLCTRNPRRPP